MAFNPFTSFRKYRTFWMAGILLLTMITFVLCTGAGQGDLSDILLKIFGRRGTTWAQIDNRNVSSSEFYDLKERRNIANEFMRAAGKFSMMRMDEELKPENIKKAEQNPKDRERLGAIQGLRTELEKRLRPQRFFETGVKIDELVDFKILLAEADRMSIDMTDEAIMRLLHLELTRGAADFFNAMVYNGALQEVRRSNPKANEAVVKQTLRDEFKVRLAQRVLGESGTTRLGLTPAQMWDMYREKRVEYKVSLLPLYVEDFVKKIGEPDAVALESLFKEHRNKHYDPASESPGFAVPNRVKVAWVMGDASSDYFRKLSSTTLQLQASLPMAMSPYSGLSVLTAQAAKTQTADIVYHGIAKGGRFKVGSWAEADPDISLAAFLTQKDPVALTALIGASALRADAGLIAGATDARIAAIGGMYRAKPAYDAGLREIARARVSTYASAVALGAALQGIAVPGLLNNLDYKEDHLPLAVIEDLMLRVVESNLSRKWVKDHMVALKDKLEKMEKTTTPTARAMEDTLSAFVANDRKIKGGKLKDLGLEYGESKDWHHRYNVQEAKELESLRKAYLAYYDQINQFEGRDIEPEKKLKETDFWKMFFDGGERFSATSGKYRAKPWPPAVTVFSRMVQQARLVGDPKQIDDPRMQQLIIQAANTDVNQPVILQFFEHSDKPILFWRTGEEPALVPVKVDEVRDKVVEAWKLNKARTDIVLPRAKQIAETIQKSGTPSLTMDEALKKLKDEYGVKREIIPLDSPSQPLSPLVPVNFPGNPNRLYAEYELPRDLIPYPRKDTAAQVLSLYNLPKAFEIGYPPLDDINKALREEVVSKDKKPEGKYVQILTNQPRTAFYIAVERGEPEVSMFGFQFTLRNVHDKFFETAQADASKRFRTEFMEQLRVAHKLVAPEKSVRDSFDTDAHDK